MAGLKLTGFSGERPSIISRLLPDTAAKLAINTRMDDGALSPLNLPAVIASISDENHRTIYQHDGEWLSWAGLVNAVPGPVASDRLYFTGDGLPKMKVAGVDYPLAVPRTATALTATLTGSGTGDKVTRRYVFTWVTSFGEESEPNKASNAVNWQPGNDVTLSGFPATPGGRSITLQRIYRSQTGQSGTAFYFIAERAATDADFVDNIAIDAFAEALPSASWNTPPDDLDGLTAMPNGMMAGFVDNKIYFCEAYRPHAWPEKYVLTCDTPIIGLGSIGSSLIAMTETTPYILTGTTPDAMQMMKLEANFPCINRQGIVDLGFAIAYPSHDGIVTVTADGAISLATSGVLTREKWLYLTPATMVAGQLSGRYVAFYDTIDIDGNRDAGAIIFRLGAAPDIVRTARRATAVYYSAKESSLFFLAPSELNVYELDPFGHAAEHYYWRSKEFWTPAPVSFSCIQIDTDKQRLRERLAAQQALIDAAKAANAAAFASDLMGCLNDAPINHFTIAGDTMVQVPVLSAIEVGIYADGEKIAVVSEMDKMKRLPAGFTARKWEIDVAGDVQVNWIAMATSVDELKAIS